MSERLEPTCTSAGYVREKCTDCEKVKDGSYKRLASLGHDYDDWVVVKKVTCTVPGEMTRHLPQMWIRVPVDCERSQDTGMMMKRKKLPVRKLVIHRKNAVSVEI